MLVIDRAGQTYLEGEKVDFKSLGPKLEGLVHESGLVQLLLEADEDVKHGRVVQIMDLAKRSGVSKIIIAARWGAEKVF